MNTTFFFYDLETSGINPRDARIMQFAGQRTDMDLNPVGEPVNVMIALTDDVIPDPDAILVTGITPQQTLADGMTEAAFLELFHSQVATPGTIFAGYNTVRFDDEFMRFMHYRNFYDPYEWQYTDQKSRWDLLDVVRMTRALRPDGISWPVDKNGIPTNRLELLTKENGIEHSSAHDALNDVEAVISLARLIQQKQPKLFEFLLQVRDKKAVAAVVEGGKPFVYSSGKYASEFDKTTVVSALVSHPKRQGMLVYDLRHDPTEFATMTVDELVAAWQWNKEDGVKLPVKTLQYNRCPAVAPLSVLDEGCQKRLQLDMDTLRQNYRKLQAANLTDRLLKALEKMDVAQEKMWKDTPDDVDTQLYNGFFNPSDKAAMQSVRVATGSEIQSLLPTFLDQRLNRLFPLFKARNFRTSLSDEERQAWELFRTERLMAGGVQGRMGRFFNRLAELAANDGLTTDQRYLLEELQLYGQSIMPTEEN